MTSHILKLAQNAKRFAKDLGEAMIARETVQVDIVTNGQVPMYATPGSAGVDLMANIPEKIAIGPGKVKMIPTGIKIAIHDRNIVAKLYPRSGKSTREGLILANGTGIIDSDYRGEVVVAARNASLTDNCYVEPGERIAQMLFEPVIMAQFNRVQTLDETERGEGGFGSTGKQ
jgi:dUTP pyrophosphatase